MSTEYSMPLRLNADSVREYIVNRGGKVYNTDLVKYFKPLLTDPENKELAREQFKRIINQIAVVTRDEKGEKYLVLKKPASKHGIDYESSPIASPEPGLSSATSFSSLATATGLPHASSIDSLCSIPSLSKQPPPYRSPPPVLSPKSVHNSNFGYPTSPSELPHEKTPPPVPPRRRSSDKIKFNNKENEPEENSKPPVPSSSEESENKVAENEQKISVKERTQRFNRLASTEGPIPKIQQAVGTSTAYKKRFDKGTLSDREDDDSASVASFDPRSREWLVRAAQGNYQALAKMCSENPKLAKFKDPATTALHWGAKHGNLDIIKLIAGTCKMDANIRTGYTSLHIAAQFNRDDAYDLLIKVYGADPSLRDWSGRKPFQYKNTTNQNSSLKADSLRKIKSQKKHSEKDLGFLRIGSLNVRVKRTTEAVSNFLGVSQSNLDKAHKTWGSADSIQDCKKMPPPKFAPVKKRGTKSKHIKESSSARSSVIISEKTEEKSDSDSDTAFGFDANWKQTV